MGITKEFVFQPVFDPDLIVFQTYANLCQTFAATNVETKLLKLEMMLLTSKQMLRVVKIVLNWGEVSFSSKVGHISPVQIRSPKTH